MHKIVTIAVAFIVLVPVALFADYYNPCGIIVGKEAYFKMSVRPDDYPDANIVWLQSGTGTVSFVGGNTGRTVTVRGETTGDVTLSIQIGDARSARPRFEARVVDEYEVGVALWILTDGTNAPCSSGRALELLGKASEVWKQVGLKFRFCGLTVTNCPGMTRIVRDDKCGVHFSDVVSIGGFDPGTINCYFVESIYGDAEHTVGLGEGRGVVLTPKCGELGLAHEIGHVYGLADVYDGNATVDLAVPVRREMMPEDWNGGSGQRYYASGTKLPTLLERLLMYGEVGDGADITKGDVFGFWYDGDASDTNRVEHCSLAPVGFFKRFDGR